MFNRPKRLGLVLSLLLMSGNLGAQGMPNPLMNQTQRPTPPLANEKPLDLQQDIGDILKTFRNLIKPIGQADVDTFLACAEAVNSWLASNGAAQQALTNLSVPQRWEHIQTLGIPGLEKEDALLIQAMRMKMAEKSSQYDIWADAEAQLKVITAKEAELNQKLNRLPPKRKELAAAVIDKTKALFETMVKYPRSNADVYRKNEKKIQAGFVLLTRLGPVPPPGLNPDHVEKNRRGSFREISPMEARGNRPPADRPTGMPMPYQGGGRR